MPSQRRVTWAKYRVGATCVVALIIIATLVYLLTGGTLLQQKATVFMYIADATGLAKEAPVRVDGIEVGRVTWVELSNEKRADRVVRVIMTIQRERLSSIPTDSYAQLSSENLVGDKFVDITSGTAPTLVAPNGEIPFRGQGEFMKSLDLSQFETQLRLVDATLTDIEQGRSRVGQFVLGDQFYTDVRQKLSDLQRAMRNIASTTSQMGEALYTDKLYRQIRDPLVTLDQDLARMQSGQGSLGQLLRDTGQYTQFQTLAHDLQKSIQDLRASEFLKSEQMYTELNRGLTSLAVSVDRMNANPLLTRSDTYESLNGLAREFGTTVRDFRQDPKKYLRLKVF